MKKLLTRLAILAFVPMLAIGFLPATTNAMHTTEAFEMITLGSTGLGGNAHSERARISADGTKVVFQSYANDLIDGITTNSYQQVYLYDTITQTTQLVSAGPLGVGGGCGSMEPAISADGKWVVYRGCATDLIDGMTTSGNHNIFLYNIATGATQLITTGPLGDGGNCTSYEPEISANGSRISFYSCSTDLIGGMTTTYGNIFLYDVPSATTNLVTKGPAGLGGNTNGRAAIISADGRYVVFSTQATDLIDGITTIPVCNVFIYDSLTDKMTLVTRGPFGDGVNNGETTPSDISFDNSFVVFGTKATDVIDGLTTNGYRNLYLYDIATEETTLLTAGPSGVGGDGDSSAPFISHDRTTVSFVSKATDLIPGLTTNGEQQIFTYDIATGTISLLTAGPLGIGADGYSYRASMSADGSTVAFHSYASDLIDDFAPNSQSQIYLYRKTTFCDFTFDPQNGAAPWTEEDVMHCRVDQPTDPVRGGYIFNGWWTAPTGGKLWNFNDRATDDVTLYAQWIAIPGAPDAGVSPGLSRDLSNRGKDEL